MEFVVFLVICGLCAGAYYGINWMFDPPVIVKKIMLGAIVVLLSLLLLKAVGLLGLIHTQIPHI